MKKILLLIIFLWNIRGYFAWLFVAMLCKSLTNQNMKTDFQSREIVSQGEARDHKQCGFFWKFDSLVLENVWSKFAIKLWILPINGISSESSVPERNMADAKCLSFNVLL